jgi:ABC-type transport system substrate-binding protein
MNDQVAGAAPLRSYFDELESYEALDDHTFRISFKKPKYMQKVVVTGLYPLPKFLYAFDEAGEAYEPEVIGKRFEDHWYNPMGLGAGPYKLTRFEPGVAIELERNARFPLGGNAMDKIVYSILKDQNQPPRKLRTGELHLSSLQPAQYRAEVLEGEADSPFKNGDLKGGEFWSYNYFYIGWNADQPYFADKRVRQAMSHAFNAQLLIDDVFLGLGERCTGPMPTVQPYYDRSLDPYAFDLERAKALLDEAGWTDTDGDGIRDKLVDGESVPFDFKLVVFGSSNEYKTVGNIYKEDLAKIGVKMNVAPMEWANLLKKVDAREFDAVTLAWVSGPPVDFRQIWHSSQADLPKGSNRVGFRNPEADRIIEALEVEFDERKRRELAQEFHRLLYDEQPYTFFYTRKSTVYWQKELQNVWFQLTRPHVSPRPFYFAG